MDLMGKVVIVTGASSGIGLATAKLLAKQGAKLVLVARSRDKLEKLAREIPGSIAIPTDMTKPLEIKKLVRQAKYHFRRVDVLINNAGQGYDAPIEKTNLERMQMIYNLSMVGPLVAMQEVIPLMRYQRGGAIVNVSSGTALMRLANNGAYSSIKKALAQLSLTAREELKKDNITVSVVYPYMTATDFEKNTLKNNVPLTEEKPPIPPDTAEFVAEKILEAIQTGEAEVFAHDWMKTMGRQGSALPDAP